MKIFMQKAPFELRLFFIALCIGAIILLTALFSPIIGQNNEEEPRYWTRFAQHLIVQNTNQLQYRETYSELDLQKFFGTEGIQVSIEQWKRVENDLGVNFPGWIDDQIVGFRLPLDHNIQRRVSGFEFVQGITIGLPYIQGRIQWASAGRLEQMSPFAQPARVWSLATELVRGDYPAFAENVTTAAIEHYLNQQALVRGRIDMIFELNIRNIIRYKLNHQPIFLGAKRNWSLDGNLFPYWVWKSFDASNRIGVAEGFRTQDNLDQQIEKIQAGPLFEDLLKDASGLLSTYIDRQIFVPAGWPLYNGYGCRGELVLKLRNSISFTAMVEYNQLSNNARGVSPVQSWSFSAGVRTGLGGYQTKNTSQKKPTIEFHAPEIVVDSVNAIIDTVVFYTPGETIATAPDTLLHQDTTDFWVIRLGLFQSAVDLRLIGMGKYPIRGITQGEFFAVYVDETFSSQEAANTFARLFEIQEFLIEQKQ
jgi:hypothetical protein